MAEKAVLAFSGGLDTSVVVSYLQNIHKMDVITVTIDVGQGDDLAAIRSKAESLGVLHHYNIDAKAEFVSEYVVPSIKANALYQRKYCLATALARPLIAKKITEVAEREGADALAHGCSGKGNDQVRFEVAMRASTALPIIAPIRDMNLDRTEEIEFARKHGIPIDAVAKKYSIDQNLWGRAIEGGPVEDAFFEPPNDAFIWTSTGNYPRDPAYVEIGFEGGVPASLDGDSMEVYAIIERLNKTAGEAGVGITDHIEDRTVGIKSREIYETPAALCLIEAHADLEKMVHTVHQNRLKEIVDSEWARLVYSGLWNDPLRRDIDAFIDSSQGTVNGTVRLRLHQGAMRVVGRRSPDSLYNRGIATYGADSTFDQRQARGFVELWGLQTTEANKLQGNTGEKT